MIKLFKKIKSFIKRKKKEVKIAINKNIPYVEVLLGNKKYKLLIDTGASTTILDSSLYEEIRDFHKGDLTKVGEDTIVTGFGESRSIDIYDIPIIINDRLYFQNVLFTKLEVLDTIEEETSIKLKGILGCDFFIENSAIINFYNEKIIL